MAEFYDETTKVIIVPPEDDTKAIHPGGMGCCLFEKLKEHADSIYQIDGVTGEQDTFGAFLDRCIRTAEKMNQLGLKPGDIISICSHNHLDNSVPLIAALFNGIIVASVDPSFSQVDMTYLMGIVKPKIVFLAPGSEELVRNGIEKLGSDCKMVVFGDSDEYMEFKEFSQFECDVDGFKPRIPASIKDTAIILFSSGTTGMPKGICLSHKAFLHNINIDIEGIFFGYAGLYWLSAHLITYSAIMFGRTKLVNIKFDRDTAWDVFHRHKVNNLFLAPCDAIQLSHRMPDYKLEHIRLLVIGGGGIPWEFIEKFRKELKDAKVGLVYGQTELLGVFNIFHPLAYDKKSCVGLPMPERGYKIVDPETEETLGPNQEGELRVKSDYCMNGYYCVESSDAWDSEGFIKTGDIAYFDDDFCFFIIDRIKEMFKYRSWHIVPAQLEAILANHPSIELVVVVGTPNVEDDNHATAVVILKSGAAKDPEGIRKYLDDQVDDRHRLRGGVKFMDEFPLTPSGKIKRREIVKMIVNDII